MIKAIVNYAMVLVIAMAATAVLMVHISEGAEYVVGDNLVGLFLQTALPIMSHGLPIIA